jgi:hypothetical protein
MMNPVTLLSLGRIAVGVASIAKPELVAKQMTGSAEDPPLLTQWFGNREIALGLVTLLSRGGHRKTLILAGMAVDAADAGTTYSAMNAGSLPKKLAVPAIAVAAGAVFMGLFGLGGGRKKTKKTAKAQ